MTFTTRPTLRGTFGMVSSTHWLASAVRDGRARARRQRVRRRRRRRVRAARRRAAPQRSRRRGAGDLRHRRRPDAAGALRPGPGPGRRHHRALPVAGPRPRARLRPARRGRPRRGRRLAAAAARPRHPPLADVLDRRSATPRDGHPLLERGRRDRRARCGSCSPSTGRPRPSSGCRDGRPPAPGELVTNPAYADDAATASSTRARPPGATGRRRSTRPGAPGARVSSPRRSTRSRRQPFRDSSGERPRRAWSPATTWPAFSAHLGAAGHAGLARAHDRQDRRSGARARCCCRRWPMLDALDDPRRSTRPRLDGIHASGRGAQARVRRPRGVVRRRARRAAGRRCSSPAYAAERARAGRRPRLAPSCGPAARRARRRGCPAHVRRRWPRRATVARGPEHRRADRRADGETRGDTCHVDVVDRWGNIDLGHAERRLAAELADHPGARLLPRQPGADVLAGGGAAVARWRPGRRPRTTLTPDAGAARRASRCWPAARPAATSRTSGSCCSCCGTSPAGRTCRRRSTPRRGTRPASRRRSTRARSSPACWCVEDRLGADVLAGAARPRPRRPPVRTRGRLGRMCAVTRDPRDRRPARAGGEPARRRRATPPAADPLPADLALAARAQRS